MGRALVATAAYEGGYFTPDKNPSAPIRIYSDRWVEDDFARRITGNARRERLSRNAARMVRRAAARNRAEGFV